MLTSKDWGASAPLFCSLVIAPLNFFYPLGAGNPVESKKSISVSLPHFEHFHVTL